MPENDIGIVSGIEISGNEDDSPVRIGPLDGNYTVTKYDPLLFMQEFPFSLSECKLFDAYLSRINPNDPSIDTVLISLDDFAEMTDITKIKRSEIIKHSDRLLREIVRIPNSADKLEFKSFQLFSICDCERGNDGNYYIRIRCHERAKKFFFRGKTNVRFIRYAVRNIMRLQSKHSYLLFLYLVREFMSGKRPSWTVPLVELRDRWFRLIDDETYHDYRYFKRDVLDKAVREVNEKTDLTCAYEGIRSGRSIAFIRFTVSQKKRIPQSSQTSAGKKTALPSQTVTQTVSQTADNLQADAEIKRLREITCGEFTDQDIRKVVNALDVRIPFSEDTSGDRRRFFAADCYNRMCKYDSEGRLNNRFAYFLSMVERNEEPKYMSESAHDPFDVYPDDFSDVFDNPDDRPELLFDDLDSKGIGTYHRKQNQEKSEEELETEFDKEFEENWASWIFQRDPNVEWTEEQDNHDYEQMKYFQKVYGPKKIRIVIADALKIPRGKLRWDKIDYL